MAKRKFHITLEYEDHDEIGFLVPIKEFENSCIAGIFVSSDGHGYYATATRTSNVPVNIREIVKGNMLQCFTHIMWYNK